MKSKTKIEKQSLRKGNRELVETIRLAKKSNSKDWIKVAEILSQPRRKQKTINLDEIEALVSEGDSIVFPGKVLSQGDITKKIAVIAVNFSEKSKEKLLKTKSQAINMAEEIKKNPHAKGLKFFPDLGDKEK